MSSHGDASSEHSTSSDLFADTTALSIDRLTSSLSGEIYKLGVLALPTIVAATVGARLVHANIVQIIVGNCGGEPEQAAAGLVIAIYVPLTVAATGIGLTTGVLSSQAIGAGNNTLLGEWLLTGSITISMLGIVCCTMCIALTPLLVAWSVSDVHVQRLATGFSIVFVWNAVVFQFFQMIRSWFQAQGIVLPFVCAACVGVVCNGGIGTILACSPGGVGWTGAAIGIIGGAFVQLLLIFAWASWSRGKYAFVWTRARWQSALKRQRLLQLLRQGGYRAMWLVLDEAACMVVGLLSGRLGEADVASQSVYFLLWALVFGMQVGLGTAVSTRVSLHLGAGGGQNARQAMMAGLIAFFLLTVIIVILLFATPIARLFSEDEAVQNLIDANRAVLALCIAATSASTATMLPLSNSAEDVRCLAFIVAFSSWVIGLPMAAFLGIGPPALGLRGLWFGLTLGEASKAVAAGYVLMRFDWNAAAEKIRKCSQAVDRSERTDAHLNEDARSLDLLESEVNGEAR